MKIYSEEDENGEQLESIRSTLKNLAMLPDALTTNISSDEMIKKLKKACNDCDGHLKKVITIKQDMIEISHVLKRIENGEIKIEPNP